MLSNHSHEGCVIENTFQPNDQVLGNSMHNVATILSIVGAQKVKKASVTPLGKPLQV